MTVEKPKPKQLLRRITTGAGNAMSQSQFLAITWNSLEARAKSRVRGAIGFGFYSHWLKNWRESLKPTTKRSDRNHVITFDSLLKTTLLTRCGFFFPLSCHGVDESGTTRLPRPHNTVSGKSEGSWWKRRASRLLRHIFEEDRIDKPVPLVKLSFYWLV